MIFGLTFKENCPDVRNSRVADIIRQFNKYGIDPIIVDPWASAQDAMDEYGIKLIAVDEVTDADCIIFAVAHKEFREMKLENISKMYKNIGNNEKVLIDVKGLFNISELIASGMRWWRL